MTPEPGDPQHSELVMPFVVCRSQDGPYDDDSFVAGYEAGIIDSALHALAPVGGTITRTVRSDLLPQLDLIAMRYGFEMEANEWDEHPEWTFVQFARATEGGGS